jgi:NADH-quinone oxidoreductase subunit E
MPHKKQNHPRVDPSSIAGAGGKTPLRRESCGPYPQVVRISFFPKGLFFALFRGSMDMHAAPSSGTRQADQIPADLLAKIDEAVTHYPVSKRSASLPLLHLWQNHFGFVDESGVDWIAKRLDLESINILELVTFYPWFRQQKAGRVSVRVCRTLSCALAGGYEVREAFCKAAGIDPKAPTHGHTPPVSPDGKFSVEFVECLASCGSAPVALVNDDLHEDITPEGTSSILGQYN